MNVPTLTMPVEAARERLKAYRAGIHRRADEEWERAAVAYERLAQGTPLIQLSQAIQNAPCDVRGRPLLAIARADRKQVQVYLFDRGTVVDYDTQRNVGRRYPGLSHRVTMTRPAMETWGVNGFALVPMVPPDVLGTRQLKTHYVLWDVVAWADQRIGARPDRDPYLLERVADDLFAVVGEWDLTDVERAVMGDRARR